MDKTKHCKKLIEKIRRGEEAHAELLELLGEKIEQAYFAQGAYADKPFSLEELWFDHEKKQMFLNYSAWCGEYVPDCLSFGIDIFLATDFKKEAEAVIVKNKIIQQKKKLKEEQNERELLAKLKLKYKEE